MEIKYRFFTVIILLIVLISMLLIIPPDTFPVPEKEVIEHPSWDVIEEQEPVDEIDTPPCLDDSYMKNQEDSIKNILKIIFRQYEQSNEQYG